MIRKVLIANRGEIALRVARACRELGLGCVVVHSTADRDPAAARLADDVVQIGPAPGRHSYMSIPAVIEAARTTGADAVHPGYGFLSEDPYFAEICVENGLTFVGPPPVVMAELGDKSRARELMSAAGVPVLGGSDGAVEGPDEATAVAARIGLPVILKAVAGGGGRGMRVVRDLRDIPHAVRETRAHARAVFTDPRVYVERFVQNARHIEIQVMCDDQGNAVHLGERDCSVQRRQQKLLEESPAYRLPRALAEEIGTCAVRGVRSLGFRGAGTVEFLVEPDGTYSFLEVNSRIQVEHPVTEMVTGIDLVREQLLVASGWPLSFTQDDVRPRGCAIECRVNAEDPARGFVPTPGLVDEFTIPGGPFTRVDTHFAAGDVVGPHYDSLLAKVVVWAPDREAAIARMARALGEFRVRGPYLETTRAFLGRILDHPDFRAGRHTTAMVDQLIAAGEPAAAGPGPGVGNAC
ncbi:MAG: acetyl-CoA carboxylase biotin carboxylase subunit [Geodermatophilaceae bacterium]